MSAAPKRQPTIDEIFDSLPGAKEMAATRRAQADAKAIDDYHAATRLVQKQAERLKRGGYQKLGALLTERTTVEWLLRDQLEAGIIALIAGPRGSYKSALINDWAMRVAVLKGLPVFVLSPEGSGLQRRLQGWLDEFAPFADPADVPLYVRNRRLNISDSGELDALVEWLAEIEKETGKAPALVVIDTWSKSTGHDENDNSETRQLIGELDRRVRHRTDKACTVAIVAHTGHGDQNRARGASSLSADTDAEYIVSFGGTVRVTRQRFKDSASLPPLYFLPKIRTLDYRDKEEHAVTSVVLMPAEAPGPSVTGKQQLLVDRIRELVEAGTPATEKAVIEGLGRPPDERRRLKVMLDRGGIITFDGNTYAIAERVYEGSGAEFEKDG